MVRRAALALATLYVAAAMTARAQERLGMISCGCAEDCWCKRPRLSLFRWTFPFGHAPRG